MPVTLNTLKSIQKRLFNVFLNHFQCDEETCVLVSVVIIFLCKSKQWYETNLIYIRFVIYIYCYIVNIYIY